MLKNDTLGTIWEIPDEFWMLIAHHFPAPKPPGSPGRLRSDMRKILEGILWVLRDAPLSVEIEGANVRCRRLLIRWEKKIENYFGLIALAATVLIYRITKQADPNSTVY